MIRYTSGDIFEEPAEVRINTVNCVGVMGAGVALAFKTRYPDMFRDYQKACKKGDVKPGNLHTWKTLIGEWIVNFPTKRHWREPSRYDDIEAGLVSLKDFLGKLGAVRASLPALGCGHGGLEWSRVSEMIEQYLSDLEAEIVVFSPQSSRDAGDRVTSAADNDEKLQSEGVVVLGPGDEDYPNALKGRSAASLYVKGDITLFNKPIFTVILSNKPDDRELKAATECVDAILSPNITLMLNYGASERVLIRKAMDKKARVILCLAEGILNFSVRKDLKDVWDDNSITVFSAFKPRERWNPSAAFRVKDLEMTFAQAVLISDPEPLWLEKFIKESHSRQLPPIFYIKYSSENEKTRELFAKSHAHSIGRNSVTGNPNMHPVQTYFFDESLSRCSFHSGTPANDNKFIEYSTSFVDHNQIIAESGMILSNPVATPILLVNSEISQSKSVDINSFESFIKHFDEAASQKAMTSKELIDYCKINKTQLNEWLKQGVSEKKIKKLSKPVRFQLLSQNQLELNI